MTKAWRRIPNAPEGETYRQALDEALARLDRRDKTHRASLDLVLGEMDRLPDAEALWDYLATTSRVLEPRRRPRSAIRAGARALPGRRLVGARRSLVCPPPARPRPRAPGGRARRPFPLGRDLRARRGRPRRPSRGGEPAPGGRARAPCPLGGLGPAARPRAVPPQPRRVRAGPGAAPPPERVGEEPGPSRPRVAAARGGRGRAPRRATVRPALCRPRPAGRVFRGSDAGPHAGAPSRGMGSPARQDTRARSAADGGLGPPVPLRARGRPRSPSPRRLSRRRRARRYVASPSSARCLRSPPTGPTPPALSSRGQPLPSRTPDRSGSSSESSRRSADARKRLARPGST